jgi:hypothetical protein
MNAHRHNLPGRNMARATKHCDTKRFEAVGCLFCGHHPQMAQLLRGDASVLLVAHEKRRAYLSVSGVRRSAQTARRSLQHGLLASQPLASPFWPGATFPCWRATTWFPPKDDFVACMLGREPNRRAGTVRGIRALM